MLPIHSTRSFLVQCASPSIGLAAFPGKKVKSRAGPGSEVCCTVLRIMCAEDRLAVS